MYTTLHKHVCKYLLFAFFSVAGFTYVKAQSETFNSGAFIINMGATNPNTIANGLKPYGLVYDLMRNHKVPVKWVISQTKLKDGADFSYNGVQYKGGTFIIPAEYRTAAVNARITSWQGQGVVGVTTTSTLTVNVSYTLTTLPRWTFDGANGSIAQSYLTNAGITLSAFPGAYNFKGVALLDCCDDLFVMPHADPKWSTHSRLYSWNRDCRGAIWGACHMVSALENSINPANSTQQMNFLTERNTATTPTPWPNNSLVLWTQHLPGSVPYTHRLFSDPIAQYMGTTDAAQLNGSEQIYVPKQSAPVKWRAGAKIIAYDPSQANVPSVNPDLSNAAVLIAYGHGFDDPTRGLVMYEAGHSHNLGTAGDVAAQRAFLNFSFFQGIPKAPQSTVSGISNGQLVVSGNILNLSVSASSPITGVSFSYQWTSTCGGTFSNPTSSTTNFTAPAVGSNTNCILTCTVTDNCGRTSYKSFSLTVLPPPRPPVTVNDNLLLDPSCETVTGIKNVLTNDSDPDGDPITLTNVTGAANGTVSFTASGNITYTANAGFYGTEVLTYTACDNTTPLCSNGTLTITVGNPANVPPAVNDAFTIAEDAIGTFNVIANDLPNAGLTVSAITSGPSNGKISINTNNTITYIPNADFAGTDNFTYRVVNTLGYAKTAIVAITVTNDACDAGTYQSAAGSSGTITVNTSLADTYINQDGTPAGNSIRNYGTCVDLSVNRRGTDRAMRSMVKFDLSTIPAGATITGARLRLYLNREGGAAYDISVHKVLSNWNEGTLCNANNTAASNGANWANRNFTTAWTTAGGDFGTALSTINVPQTTGVYYEWTGLQTAITDWLNAPASNYGFLLKAVTENLADDRFEFDSKEAANKPQLVIDYTIPATCAAIPVRAPLALPDTATTNSTTAVSIPVTVNDALFGEAITSLTITTAPSNGSAIVSGNNIIYTPSGTFNGIMSFQYTIATANGSDVVNAYVYVSNTPLTAFDDAPAGALSGTIQAINVKANDTDPENAALTVTVATAPSSGTATVDGSGNILYTPNAGFTGNDTLYYSICEPSTICGTGNCDTARVVMVVQNRIPVAVNDAKTVLPCQDNVVVILANDADPENGVLTVNITTPPANGTASVNTDGTITYRANAGFSGTDVLNYSVTDNGVTPLVSLPATISLSIPALMNNAPVINSDYADTTNMDEVLYYSVRDNDTDPDGHNLDIPTVIVQPLHGTATVMTSGIIQYTPNPGFYGADTLIYRVCDLPVDPSSCSNFPPLCDTAKMFIYIKPKNIVVAVNDENSTLINTSVRGIVLTNDSDPDEGNPVSFAGFFSGGFLVSSGTISVSGSDDSGTPVANAGTIQIFSNGVYHYTPANNFTGVISAPYVIQDANPNTATDSAVLMITVTPNISSVNSLIANNDENTTLGSPVSSSLFMNDTDPQGNSFSLTAYQYDSEGDGTADAAGTIGFSTTVGGITETGMPVTNAGTILILANGDYTYTPAEDFHGYIDVPYTITDALGAQSSSILHIDVLSRISTTINTAPAAGDDFAYTNINTPVTSSFINNDGDPDTNPVSLNGVTINSAGATTPVGTPVTTAKSGTIQFFANGTYTYSPPPGYTGADSVGYTICDVTAVNPQPLCTNAFIHILIGINNSTDAINDENSTWQDVNISENVLNNDFDKETNTQAFGSFILQNLSGDLATGSTISGTDKTGTPVANAGVLSFDANGNYTFDPEPSFTGTVSVPYRISDNGNRQKVDTAYLTITVDPLPSTGINIVMANNDENISYGNAVSNNLFINDKDPQNDLFTLTAISGGIVGTSFIVSGKDQNGNTVANAGTLLVSSSGSYTYTPGSFTGSINVPYILSDALGATSTAILHIDVVRDPNGLQNDPPFAGDDYAYTTINKPVSGSFINNDTDFNSDPVSISGTTINTAGPAIPVGSQVTTAQGGSVQFYANGTYLYTPPAGYVGPDKVNYVISDVTVINPQPLTAEAIIHFLIGPGIILSGKVWDDADGSVTDAGVTEPETNISNTLYVNLADGFNNVIAVTAVASDGSYSFTDITPGVNYSITLSPISGIIGQPAPAPSLPAGWVNTGETRNGTIDFGNEGMIDSRAYGFTNVINFDFGIEQLPNSDDQFQTIPVPVGHAISEGIVTQAVSGSDPEDGILNNTNAIVITNLPANATMFYNGLAVTAWQQITGFDPAFLSFAGITTGSTSVIFNYSFKDAAGRQDPTPASYTINWSTPLPVRSLVVSATLNNSVATISWITENEVNTSRFEVERSTDNRNFTIVGTAAAAGNNPGTSRYSLNDNVSGLSGVIYYRIKLVDIDGKLTYSNIVAIRITNVKEVKVWPNPFVETVIVSLYSNSNEKLFVRIIDNTGRTVNSKYYAINRGSNQLNVTGLSRLAKGIYTIELINSSGEIKKIQQLKKQ